MRLTTSLHIYSSCSSNLEAMLDGNVSIMPSLLWLDLMQMLFIFCNSPVTLFPLFCDQIVTLENTDEAVKVFGKDNLPTELSGAIVFSQQNWVQYRQVGQTVAYLTF